MDNDYGQDTIFVQSSIDNQDVKAEAVLRELETGKKVSLKIIYAEMANNDRMLHYGTYTRELDTALAPWAEDNKRIPYSAIQRLIDWALEQSVEMQEMVFDFLDALSDAEKDEKLAAILDKIGYVEPVDVSPKKNSSRKSMADIMMDSLPASKDELIQLIQSVSHTTRRPAATVRQWIREKTKSNKIYLDVDDRYYRNI